VFGPGSAALRPVLDRPAHMPPRRWPRCPPGPCRESAARGLGWLRGPRCPQSEMWRGPLLLTYWQVVGRCLAPCGCDARIAHSLCATRLGECISRSLTSGADLVLPRAGSAACRSRTRLRARGCGSGDRRAWCRRPSGTVSTLRRRRLRLGAGRAACSCRLVRADRPLLRPLACDQRSRRRSTCQANVNLFTGAGR
jgi:hypothetical protein